MSKEQNMEDIAQAAQEIANFLDNAERSKGSSLAVSVEIKATDLIRSFPFQCIIQLARVCYAEISINDYNEFLQNGIPKK